MWLCWGVRAFVSNFWSRPLPSPPAPAQPRVEALKVGLRSRAGAGKQSAGKPGSCLGPPFLLALPRHSPQRGGRSVCPQLMLTSPPPPQLSDRSWTDHQPKRVSKGQFAGRQGAALDWACGLGAGAKRGAPIREDSPFPCAALGLERGSPQAWRPAGGPRLPRGLPSAHLLPAVAGQLLLGEEPHRGPRLGGARRLPGPGCGRPWGQRQEQGQRCQPPQPPPGHRAHHGARAERGRVAWAAGWPGRLGPRAPAPRPRNPAPPRAPAASPAPAPWGPRRWRRGAGLANPGS